MISFVILIADPLIERWLLFGDIHPGRPSGPLQEKSGPAR